jgi:hypothetical protein
MMPAITRAWERFRGSGEAAVTVAPMDGALRPNTALEDARLWRRCAAPDNLAFDGRHIFFTSGTSLLGRRLDVEQEPAQTVEVFDSDISCLAVSANAGMAVGLDRGCLIVRPAGAAAYELTHLADRPLTCPIAATFADERTLYVCLGSRQTRPSEWKRDLLSGHSSGSVWRIDVTTRHAECVADALAYPHGIACTQDGSLLISESWRHRLLRIEPDGTRAIVFDDLPGYPGRLTLDAARGNFWLNVFAPRRQLIEFVLRERAYRERMMREIDPAHWLAPSLHPPRSHLETLQYGCIRQLGELKPWAPVRSCGLVVELDEHHRPARSFHSRANGTRHGATSCLPTQDGVLVTCKGGDAIIELDLSSGDGL